MDTQGKAMPYSKWSEVNPAVKGIKPKVTLGQANSIARMADAIGKSDKPPKSPWAVAISSFKKSHTIKDGKWKKKAKHQESDMSVQAALETARAIINRDPEMMALAKEKNRTPEELGNALLDNLERELTEAVPESETEVVEHYDPDPYPYIPLAAVTFADLAASDQAREISKEVKQLTYQFKELIDNIMFKAEIENKPAAIRALTEEFVTVVEGKLDVMPEVAETEEAELSEISISEDFAGSIILVEEAVAQVEARSPLKLDVRLIRPGFGNKKDNHYYPAEVLSRDASVFEGAKMYATNHRNAEKSVRTEVSVIEKIVDFVDGAPIARVVIFNPDFAEATRNRAAAGQLNTLECSILAAGTARKGKVDGKKAKIVEAITSAQSVDWVTKAGAGGRALTLVEADTVGPADESVHPDEIGGDSMLKEKEKAAEPTGEVTEKVEEVAIEEGDPTAEPAPEPTEVKPKEDEIGDEPTLLSEADVAEALDGSKLPKAARMRLAESDYETQEKLTEAIKAEKAYVSKLTGAGLPVGQGGSQPQQLTPEQLKEDTDRFYDGPDGLWNRMGLKN